MAYKKAELEKQALAAIKKYKPITIEELIGYLPCTKTTYYAKKLHESQVIQNRLLASIVAYKKQKSEEQSAIDGIVKRWNKSRGYVYLIHQESSIFYKIGSSKMNPKARLDYCQRGNPNKLEMIEIFDVHDCFALERYLHIFFEQCNVRGEWFSLCSADVDLLHKTVEQWRTKKAI